MPIYEPMIYRDKSQPIGEDGSQPALPGVFCICEPATFADNEALLTPYRDDDPTHLQNVFAGDTTGAVTVTLHFPDEATARSVMAQVNG